MTKLRIGSTTFDAGPLKDYPGYLGQPTIFSRPLYFSFLLNRIDKELKLMWDCQTGTRTPDPYPRKFTGVEPHLLIYYDPDKAHFGQDRRKIDRASMAAGGRFLKALGFANANALVKAINAEYGVYDINFDVDAAIAADKPRYQMDINVSLVFAHFELTNPKIVPEARIVLSLPDRVGLMVHRTMECTETGLKPVEGAYPFDLIDSIKVVRAKTKSAYRARYPRRKEKLDVMNARLKELKEDIEKMRKEIEDSKPESD